MQSGVLPAKSWIHFSRMPLSAWKAKSNLSSLMLMTYRRFLQVSVFGPSRPYSSSFKEKLSICSRVYLMNNDWRNFLNQHFTWKTCRQMRMLFQKPWIKSRVWSMKENLRMPWISAKNLKQWTNGRSFTERKLFWLKPIAIFSKIGLKVASVLRPYLSGRILRRLQNKKLMTYLIISRS